MAKKRLNIYYIWQNENGGYNTYDSAVVIAASEDEAKLIHPDGTHWNPEMDNSKNYYTKLPGGYNDYSSRGLGTWARPEQVTVELIGKALPNAEPGVVCASFNAG